MTKVLTDRVEETYKLVFGDTIAEPDRERINFLRDVVTGEVDYEGNRLQLEAADDVVKQEKNELINKVQKIKVKKEKDLMLDEIASLDDTLKTYDAVRAMREWYLQAEYNDRDEAKLKAISPLHIAGLIQICESFYDCLEVLHKQRIQSLIQTLDDAFKTKKYRDAVISSRADQLLAKKVPELTEAVITRMIPYHDHLRELLDKAVETGNERALKRAAVRLNDTGVPSLIKYAQERMKTYKAQT